MKRTINLNDGKYTVEHVDAPDYSFKALRHGEEWRDLCGDGLVLAMFERICELEQTIQDATNCLVCAAIADPMEVAENTLAILEPSGGANNG